MDIRLNQFADVLVSNLKKEEKVVEVSSSVVPGPIIGASAAIADPGVVAPGVAPAAGCDPGVGPLKSFKCDKCEEGFNTYRLMVSHRGKEHRGSRYECETCSETFDLEAKYHAHLLEHPLECKLCGKFFNR